MAEEGSWDSILAQYLTDTGVCCAAALGTVADPDLYAACPAATGWDIMYKEDHDEQILQDDGTEKSIKINEKTTLKDTIECDLMGSGPPKNGLWVGGDKYKIVQKDPSFESGDNKMVWILATRTKKGIHIMVTQQTVVLCMYDESAGQTSGNCKKAAVEFADYMISVGQ